jgi:hypothetical protein
MWGKPQWIIRVGWKVRGGGGVLLELRRRENLIRGKQYREHEDDSFLPPPHFCASNNVETNPNPQRVSRTINCLNMEILVTKIMIVVEGGAVHLFGKRKLSWGGMNGIIKISYYWPSF